MYKRLSAVLFPVAVVALAGTALWGYQEHQEKNRILVKAENQYQRAFHDLSFHMDRLHEELGNSLAVSSASRFHRKGLVNLWRITSQAQSEVNQLPLTLMPFHETESLLANIASFSYRVAMRDLIAEPLTGREMTVLKSLYRQSEEIAGDLQKVQDSVINNHLQWMDVETLLASGRENFDNDIIDGFQLMNKHVTEYGEIDWGPTSADSRRKLSASSLSGPEMTGEQIKRKAAEFLGIPDASSLRVVENGGDTGFATYSVSVAAEDGEEPLQMEYTKKGGQLVYFLAATNVKEKKIGIDEAVRSADVFLEKHGYRNMKAVSYDEYNNVASIMFARMANGVTIYPDKLAVKVKLDRGGIAGLSAADMIRASETRTVPEPKLTEQEAGALLNPDFRIEDVSLAVIRNDMDEEVLCYEFLGGINGGNYRIYFNAETGFEEKIEHIRNADAKASNESA